MTRSCLDHIITKLNAHELLADVNKIRLWDHYFTAVTIFGEKWPNNLQANETWKNILDSELVDKYIRQYDWDILLSHNHETTYKMSV